MLMAQTDDYSSTYLAQSHSHSRESSRLETEEIYDVPKKSGKTDPVSDVLKSVTEIVDPKAAKPKAKKEEGKQYNLMIPIVTVAANIIGTVLGTFSANHVIRALNNGDYQRNKLAAMNAKVTEHIRHDAHPEDHPEDHPDAHGDDAHHDAHLVVHPKDHHVAHGDDVRDVPDVASLLQSYSSRPAARYSSYPSTRYSDVAF